MRKNKLYIVAVGLFLFGLSSCAVTDFDRSADFYQYKTFAWGKSEVDVSNPLYESDLIRKRIRHAVEEEFARRGIVKSNANPDFVVRYHTYTEEKERTTGGTPYSYRYFPFRFYPFLYGWGYAYPFVDRPQTTEYTEGTLILDIIDRRSDELVWRGSVSGSVDDESRLRKQIEKGIKAIMKKYPVTPDQPVHLDPDRDVIS
jgi:hypothetical protein